MQSPSPLRAFAESVRPQPTSHEHDVFAALSARSPPQPNSTPTSFPRCIQSHPTSPKRVTPPFATPARNRATPATAKRSIPHKLLLLMKTAAVESQHPPLPRTPAHFVPTARNPRSRQPPDIPCRPGRPSSHLSTCPIPQRLGQPRHGPAPCSHSRPAA